MTAPSTYRNVRPCGTPAAAGRHRFYGEPLCDRCREAERVRKRQQRQGLRPSRKAPRHGTVSGWQHLHRGETPCDACREAKNEDNRARRRGQSWSFRHETITQPSVILDVMETYDYPMPLQAIVSHVLDLHPEWSPKTLREVMFRLKREGKVESIQRDEWVWRLA